MTTRIEAACPQTLPEAYNIHMQVTFAPWQYSTFADAITAPYTTRVAIYNGAVAGYAQILMVVDEATLMDIAVDPKLQGQGIGRLLLNDVISQSVEAGMSAIWLEVRKSNLAAIHLYEQHHFVIQEIRKHYYPAADGREDALIMSLTLPNNTI